LETKELESIKKYRYATNGLTPVEVYIFNPFWDFIANNCYPDWLAPNVITLLGLVVPLVTLFTVAYWYPALTGVFPPWLLMLSAFANFWYMTLDATDGKQARRTDNCSPLGQILDHNLD
jgi:phosphatidylglycerophosphate synthase